MIFFADLDRPNLATKRDQKTKSTNLLYKNGLVTKGREGEVMRRRHVHYSNSSTIEFVKLITQSAPTTRLFVTPARVWCDSRPKLPG